MPKTDFSKSIIYKLCCKDPNITDEYIGSTTCFKQRKAQHKQNLKDDTKKDYRVYVTIREYGGWSNWDMIEVEKCSVNDRRELRARERYWIETLKPSLNCNLPQPIEEGLGLKEWTKQYREENRGKILEKAKKYREENRGKLIKQMREYHTSNREKHIEQMREYYAKNREKLIKQMREYHTSNREKHIEQMREYYSSNREKRKEKRKQYYANNKEIILEKEKEKVVCECGVEITKKFLQEHKKTKKHQDWEQGIITVIKGEQVECECGSIVTKNCLSRHRKTKKHQQFITSE